MVNNHNSYYNLIWRWHLYAGIFIAPFIFIIALTGSIYLFADEIDEIQFKKFLNIEAQNKNYVGADEMVANVIAKFPNAKKLAYILPKNNTRSALIRIKNDDQRQLLVAVNPFNAEIIGVIDFKNRFIWKVREIHGNLMIGKFGKICVELFASWALVLIITGLYLWFIYKINQISKKRSCWWKYFKIFIPSFNFKNLRSLIKELHGSIGLWIAGIIIFLVISGLPWSFVAGNIIKYFEKKTITPKTYIGFDQGGSKTLKSSIIDQGWNNDHAQLIAGSACSKKIKKEPVTLQQILEIAKKNKDVAQEFEVRFPVDENGVYSIVNSSKSNPQKTAFIHYDQYSATIISQALWQDFSWLSKAIAIGVSFHEGKYFGSFNQFFNLLGCVGLILVMILGFIMWLKRKNSNNFGAPYVNKDLKINKIIILIIIVLGVIMPMFGISLIIAILAENIYKFFKKKNI